MTWLRALALGAAVIAVMWAVLVVLARRLPPGVARELAGFLPSCVRLVRRLRSAESQQRFEDAGFQWKAP